MNCNGLPEVVSASSGCLSVVPCPYGKAGDRLWIRETYTSEEVFNIKAGQKVADRLIYRATNPDWTPTKGGWSPALFMPRKNSRLLLEITSVKVERLKEITEEQAIAEGVERTDQGWRCYGDYEEHSEGYIHRTSAKASFMSLWDSINGKKMPWDSNPWVWCVSFKKVDS